jgi:hypothetical protein
MKFLTRIYFIFVNRSASIPGNVRRTEVTNRRLQPFREFENISRTFDVDTSTQVSMVVSESQRRGAMDNQ